MIEDEKDENGFMNIYARKVAISFLRFFLFAFSIGILFFSIVNTGYLKYAVRDDVLLNIIFVIGVLVLISGVKVKNGIIGCVKKYSSAKIAIIYFCVGSLFLVIAQSRIVVSDPGRCLLIANQFLEHNYSSLAPGGYLDRCPHQIGLVLCYYVIALLIGSTNYLVIQLINLALFSYALYQMMEYGKEMLDIKPWSVGCLFFYLLHCILF